MVLFTSVLKREAKEVINSLRAYALSAFDFRSPGSDGKNDLDEIHSCVAQRI